MIQTPVNPPVPTRVPAAIPTTRSVHADRGASPSEAVAATGFGERWMRVLLRSFWLLLVITVAFAALAAVRGVLANGDRIYTDAILLYEAMRFRDGLPVYTDVSQPPYLVMIYWPLLPMVTGALARLADLEASGTLYLMRSLTLLATVATAAAVGGLASLYGARRDSAIAAAALFMTAFAVHPWAYTARGDLAALAPVLVGWWILLRSRSVGVAALAGALMAAGFASKQTYVVGVTVACLFLLWRRDVTRLVAVAGAWFVVVGGIALAMTVQTDGRFLQQTLASNVLPFTLDRLVERLTIFLAMSVPILALAALGWRGASATSPTPRVLWIYLALAAAAGVVSVGRVGSHYNYLLETTALLCIFAGAGLERCRLALLSLTTPGGAVRVSGAAVVAPMVLLTVTVCTLIAPLDVLAMRAVYPWSVFGMQAAYAPDRAGLIERFRGVDGPVLTERDATAVLLAGKEPIAADPVQLSVMAAERQVDVEPLNQTVRSKSFALIALTCLVEDVATYDEFTWWPAGTRELIKAHYRYAGIEHGMAMYVPAADGEIPVGPKGSDDRLRSETGCRDPR